MLTAGSGFLTRLKNKYLHPHTFASHHISYIKVRVYSIHISGLMAISLKIVVHRRRSENAAHRYTIEKRAHSVYRYEPAQRKRERERSASPSVKFHLPDI